MGLSSSMDKHTFIFIGGLHRSGTSVLHRCLREHSAVSGFSDTNFPEDEGQFLQSVYYRAGRHGGPGKFGFDPRAHLTEKTRLVSEANRDRLFSEWAAHWDLEKKY